MPKSQSLFKKLLRQAIILPLVFTFVLSIVFIWQIQRLQTSSRLVAHSNNVIAKSNDLLKMLIDAQSSVRGYMITKEKKYLFPYDINKSRFKEKAQDLLKLTADNPEQIGVLTETVNLSDKWFLYAEEILENAEKGFFKAETGVKLATYEIVTKIKQNFEEVITREEDIRNKRIRNDSRTVELATMICISAAALLGIVIFLYSRDIIQKLNASFKKNLNELEDSEARYQRASLATRDLIWEWDLKKNTIVSNEVISSEYGHDPLVVEDSIRWWNFRIHPEDYKRVFQEVAEAIKHKQNYLTSEYRFQRADGTYADVWNRGIIEYHLGQATRITGAMQDLTSLRQENQKRLEAEAVRDIFFNIPDLLLGVASREGYFIRLNESWKKILGYSMEELLGRPWVDFVHPDDVDASLFEKDRLNSGEGNNTEIFVNRYQNKEGKYVWLHWVTEARKEGIYFFATDITKLKEIEMAVESSREQLQLITNRIPAFISYVDLHLRYQFVNRAYEQWLGKPLDKIIGIPVKDILDAKTYEKSLPNMEKVLRGEPCRFENTIFDQNGELKYVDVEYVPDFDIRANSVRGFILIAHDTTERKKTEKDLKGALAVKDTFLSVASHELKTPLTTLQLQHQLARRRGVKDNGDIDREVVMKLLDQSEKSIGRLNRLIDDMLDVSRISTGKLRLRLESFDLCDLAREVLERMQPLLQQENVEVSLDCHGEVLGVWDRFRIEQVLSNLMNNALKYGKKTPIKIQVSQDQGDAYFSVQDHGPGISREDQARIFQRFERAAEDLSGLGLGLFICQEIVDRHHGKILIESELGKGAKFIVRLPIEDQSA